MSDPPINPDQPAKTPSSLPEPTSPVAYASASGPRFLFPRWANFLLPLIIVSGIGGALYVPTFAALAMHPDTLNIGYQPEQPVLYSHALHVGQLGIDCRYCHTTVEKAGFAAIPPTQTCMNCHANAATNSAGLLKIYESWNTGDPVEWVKVHDLPDYAYFNHSAHINQGVGCYSCHGRVDQMDVVYQAEPLNMGWCLSCHREPEKHLRPKDQVTSMTYHLGKGPNDLQVADGQSLAEAQLEMGRKLKERYGIKGEAFMQSCSTCHR